MDMVCMYCASPTQVINSRHQKQSNNVWRRRRCVACGSVFTTQEHADLALGLAFRATNKVIEPFLREALLISIFESCKHRPTAIKDAVALTSTIIEKLSSVAVRKSSLVDRNDVVAAAQEVLQRFDTAAATMYAAYHPHK